MEVVVVKEQKWESNKDLKLVSLRFCSVSECCLCYCMMCCLCTCNDFSFFFLLRCLCQTERLDVGFFVL
jgi:hypothetical protein